jgi:hypothetical protein
MNSKMPSVTAGLVVSREVFDEEGFLRRETEETVDHLTISPQSGKEYDVQSLVAIWGRPEPVMTPSLTGVELFTLASAPEWLILKVNRAADTSSLLVLSQMGVNLVLDLKPICHPAVLVDSEALIYDVTEMMLCQGSSTSGNHFAWLCKEKRKEDRSKAKKKAKAVATRAAAGCYQPPRCQNPTSHQTRSSSPGAGSPCQWP